MIRKERIEKMLHELRYEIEVGMMQGDIEESLGFEFVVPISSETIAILTTGIKEALRISHGEPPTPENVTDEAMDRHRESFFRQSKKDADAIEKEMFDPTPEEGK